MSILVWLAMTGASLAQAAPQTPSLVKIVIPFAAGSSPDVLARILGEQIHASAGPSIVVENKPGASGVIGAETVMRAKPDGSTLALVGNQFLTTAHVRTVPYDPIESFIPLCHLTDTPNVVAVSANSPIQTFEALLAAARAQPGKLSSGSLGPISMQQIGTEMLKKTAKVDIRFVPYLSNAQAATAAMGGQIDMFLGSYSDVAGLIAAKQMRPLAVLSGKRLTALPDVPTVREKGLDFEAPVASWLLAPAKTPEPVVAELIALFSAALKAPAVKTRLAELQLEPIGICGADFAALLRKQNIVIDQIIREAGIKED